MPGILPFSSVSIVSLLYTLHDVPRLPGNVNKGNSSSSGCSLRPLMEIMMVFLYSIGKFNGYPLWIPLVEELFNTFIHVIDTSP